MPPLQSRHFKMWAPVLAGCFVFLVCLLRSFVLPHTPLLLWGDALGYATKGDRILGGEMPYRDFFDFIPPGTQLVYAALFRIFGVSLWVPDLLMCAVGGLVAWCSTWLVLRLVEGWLVLLPGALISGFVLWGSLDPTHHWFSTLAVLLTVMLLFDRVTSWRVVLAGAMCGITATFTQSKGAAVLAGLLVYFWWESRREDGAGGLLLKRWLQLCAATAATFVAINLPFALASGFHVWFADVIVFPVRYFGAGMANDWWWLAREFPEHKGSLKFVAYPFMLVAVPLSSVWVAVKVLRSAKGDKPETQRRLMLLAIVGLAMLAGIASSLSIRRLSCVSPPAMVLLTWLLSGTGSRRKVMAKALAGLSLTIAVAQVAVVQRHRHYLLELPVGDVAVFEPEIAEVYDGMAQRTHPGEWFFGLPAMTLPLRLRNPTPIEAPSPGEYTRPEQIAAVIEGLERTRTPLLLLRPVMYTPHALGYKGDHLEPFRVYLMAHYRRTRVFATGDEVWERVGP